MPPLLRTKGEMLITHWVKCRNEALNMWRLFRGKDRQHDKTQVHADGQPSYNAVNRIGPIWKIKEEDLDSKTLCDEVKSVDVIKIFSYDFLIDEIISRIAVNDEGGPEAICRLSCVCKYFKEATNDTRVLRRIKFSLGCPYPNLSESFQGLVWKCAIMGNPHALSLVGMNCENQVGKEEDLSMENSLTEGYRVKVDHPNILRANYCNFNHGSHGCCLVVTRLKRRGWSLHDHLHGPKRTTLGLQARMKIAVGVARGLYYLHYQSNPPLIHTDLRSENIFFDRDFEPKIADFGSSKLLLERGFTGKMFIFDPDSPSGLWRRSSDIYSFGGLLLELIFVKDEDHRSLVKWAKTMVEEGCWGDLVDPSLGVNECILKLVELAIVCTNVNSEERPDTKSVLDRLIAMTMED